MSGPAVVACPKGQVNDPPTGGRADDLASEADDPVALRETGSPMRFVKLSGGEFTMGSPAGVGSDDEHPAHRVCVPAFELAVHELTNAQWPGGDEGHGAAQRLRFGCKDEMPVHDVTWDDATRFLDALSVREGREPCYANGGALKPTCDGYRLPSEAEWEYAARGGTTTHFSFGDSPDALDRYAWHALNASGRTHVVGTREANPFGLRDVHGNVWEWTQDWYGPYREGGGVDDGGLASGKFRVLRGGAFTGGPVHLRSAFRYWDGPPPFVGSSDCVSLVARAPSP